MKMTKKWGYVAGVCLTGILLTTTLAGCQSSESKTGAVESQKARDMKEADKVAVEYLKALVDMDKKKMNELHIKKYDFLPGKEVTYPEASEKLKDKYDLYRYDLGTKENEYYYKVRYYDPTDGAKRNIEFHITKDPEDGKWRNYQWGYISDFESIVGDTKPVQVHKWEGERE